MNRLMTRLYSALDNSESLILDQLSNDIQLAKDLGSLKTREYSILTEPNLSIKDNETGEVTNVEETPEGFKLYDPKSKSYSQLNPLVYLLDQSGNIMAFGDKDSINSIKSDYPNWKLVNEFDFNKFTDAITKKFSKLSEKYQKQFTEQYRQFAVFDSRGDLKCKVDLDKAKSLVNENRGWMALRFKNYMESLNNKLINYSDNIRTKIINKILSAVENCG